MAISKTKIGVSLSPCTIALLDRTGNRSGYLEDAVDARWRAWQDALGVLGRAGWTRSALRAAQDALNGYLHTAAIPLAQALSLTLADAQRDGDLCAKWEIDRATWERLRAGLEADPDLAHALLCVTRELWANEECVRRVDAL